MQSLYNFKLAITRLSNALIDQINNYLLFFMCEIHNY